MPRQPSVCADSHAVDKAHRRADGAPAPRDVRARPRGLPDDLEGPRHHLGAGGGLVMPVSGECCGVEEVELEEGEAPLVHGGADEHVEVRLDLGLGDIHDSEELARVGVARVDRPPIESQEPVGVLSNDLAPSVRSKGGHPQPRGQPSGLDLGGEGLHAGREAGVVIEPVPPRGLVPVVQLQHSQGKVRVLVQHEAHVRDHRAFRHVLEVMVPAAPPHGDLLCTPRVVMRSHGVQVCSQGLPRQGGLWL
mmetsp:Transcript_65686/g.207847  ORF Transcript_65686/g.207847 Transcript_65686/m.207847 type:complete len:249 (+) Transcript_65686:525-1271(+)